MIEAEIWREQLEPPGGGLARLVAAVQTRRRRRPAWAAFAAAGIAVAVLLGWVAGVTRQIVARHAFVHVLNASVHSAPAGPIRVAGGAALELPSSDPGVRIFAIAMLPAPDAGASAH